MQTELLGLNSEFLPDQHAPDGHVLKQTQIFPDSYWDGLQWAREQQSKHSRCREFHRVASIPTIFIELWMRRDGFDALRAPLKEVIKKLHQEHLTDFITTEKRVI